MKNVFFLVNRREFMTQSPLLRREGREKRVSNVSGSVTENVPNKWQP
jgi:hypothetical protein